MNSKRFRRSLYFLLVGVLFLSTAGSLYIGQVPARDAWIGLAIAIVLAIVAGWYILTRKYLASNHWMKIVARDSDSESGESVSELEATSEAGTRYRTLRVNKSGESSDDDS